MNENVYKILSALVCFIICSAIVFASSMGLYTDVVITGNMAREGSVTETLQLLFLVSICIGYLTIAAQNKEMRPALILVAGFFGCMFIREMDYLFDKTPVSWFYVTVVLAALCIFYAARHMQKTLAGLARFCSSKSFIVLCCGLVTILVFSRIFGMKAIWMSAMQADYVRGVKDMAEEGVELFGYTTCLIGAFAYVLSEQFVKVAKRKRLTRRFEKLVQETATQSR